MRSKMSMISLSIPASFQLPQEYLKTTAEENAAILLLGVSLLERLRNEGYTTRIETLQTQLKEQSNINTQFRQAMTSLDEHINGQIDEAVERSFYTVSDKIEELTKSMTIKERQERQSNLATIAKERDAVERRVTDIQQILDRVSALSTKMDATRIANATKGRVNENDSKQLIIDTFGTPGAGFVIHQRHDYAGDLIFDWQGLRIMWEDKNYTRTVSKGEIEKGLRDFDANRDCHILLFVSAHTSIAGYESDTDIVSEVRNGKLLLFVSSFKDNMDPAGYIRTVIQTILGALRPLILQGNALDSGEDDERLKILSAVLATISQSLHDQEKAFDTFLSDMKIKVVSMKNGLSRTKHGIDKIVSDIASSAFVSEEPQTQAQHQAETAATRGKRKCGNCGETGHLRSRCPN